MKIRIYLSNMAQDMAATTVTLLSMRPTFAKLVEQKENPLRKSIAAFFQKVAEALESGESQQLEKLVHTYACISRKSGIALVQFMDGLRFCKERVIGELQYTFSSAEKTKYLECTDKLHRLFELLMLQAASAYQQERAGQADRPLDAQPWQHEREQELAAKIFPSHEIGFVLIDPDLQILEVNDTLARMVGLSREEMLGKPIDKVMPTKPDQRYVQWVLERGEWGHYVTEWNGVWMTVSTNRLICNGRLEGALGVFVKLSDNNFCDETITKHEALASVGQLAAGMAHEIRNPLTSIKGFIQLLKEQDKQPERETYYSVILMEIERIDGLLNDVLVLARYRDENVKAQPFRVMDEVMGVVRLLEPEANRRGIKLELQIAQGDWYVYGYNARIKQAILNIMKNAFEAVHQKGKVVLVSARATPCEVVITIEDDGPGLTDEIRQKMFAPFYTTKPEGTGLGLSTTKRIITDHHGAIFADNSPRLGGARFEIRLPLITP